MRVNYPQDIHDEAIFLSQYMEYDQVLGWHLKEDVPDEIVVRYENWKKRMDEIDDRE